MLFNGVKFIVRNDISDNDAEEFFLSKSGDLEVDIESSGNECQYSSLIQHFDTIQNITLTKKQVLFTMFSGLLGRTC